MTLPARLFRCLTQTFFADECACRHELIVRLICEGCGWHSAAAAALDVAAALQRQLGAGRPKWYQGELAYTEEGLTPILRRHCVHCGGKLDRLEQGNGLVLRFCPNNCRSFLVAVGLPGGCRAV